MTAVPPWPRIRRQMNRILPPEAEPVTVPVPRDNPRQTGAYCRRCGSTTDPFA